MNTLYRIEVVSRELQHHVDILKLYRKIKYSNHKIIEMEERVERLQLRLKELKLNQLLNIEEES